MIPNVYSTNGRHLTVLVVVTAASLLRRLTSGCHGYQQTYRKYTVKKKNSHQESHDDAVTRSTHVLHLPCGWEMALQISPAGLWRLCGHQDERELAACIRARCEKVLREPRGAVSRGCSRGLFSYFFMEAFNVNVHLACVLT